jgi:hypothetical protein
MKSKIYYLIFASLLIAAHFLRGDHYIAVAICLLIPFLLVVKKRWSLRVVQAALVVAAGIWLYTLSAIAQERIIAGESWTVAGIILFVVAAYTLFVAWILNKPEILDEYPAE